MKQFTRRLDRLSLLEQQSQRPRWWDDLLRLWRPSGVEAGNDGLRLAVRDNYLNFYRKGQSVARVQLDRHGVPTAEMHHKYLFPKPDKAETPIARPEFSDQAYVCLVGDSVLNRKAQYEQYSCDKLRSWISHAQQYGGNEKERIDQVLDHNPNVIDLEMGLPAWAGQATAPRMDMVEVVPAASGGKLVFWEAKLVSDGRMRSSEEVIPDQRPEVLAQLAAYRRYLAEPGHAERIADAYREAAKVLVRLRRMADDLGTRYSLGEQILAVAEGAPLSVADQARVLAFNEECDQPAWALHRAKLERAGVKLQVLEKEGTLLLEEPA